MVCLPDDTYGRVCSSPGNPLNWSFFDARTQAAIPSKYPLFGGFRACDCVTTLQAHFGNNPKIRQNVPVFLRAVNVAGPRFQNAEETQKRQVMHMKFVICLWSTAFSREGTASQGRAEVGAVRVAPFLSGTSKVICGNLRRAQATTSLRTHSSVRNRLA